ncbi:MAG: hypothetical protein AAF633_28580 [Chloroflexota bacterium]
MPENLLKEQNASYNAAIEKLGEGTDEDEEITAQFLAERASAEPELGLSKEMLEHIRAKYTVT